MFWFLIVLAVFLVFLFGVVMVLRDQSRLSRARWLVLEYLSLGPYSARDLQEALRICRCSLSRPDFYHLMTCLEMENLIRVVWLIDQTGKVTRHYRLRQSDDPEEYLP